MKPPFLALTFLCLPSVAIALGGGHQPVPPLPPPPPPPFVPPLPKYVPTGQGPGDTTRPKGGATSGPATPAPAGGAMPTGATTSGGPTAKTGAGGPTGPATGGGGVDVTTWEYWWMYNKDEFIDLRRHVDALAPSSGSDAAADSRAAWDRLGDELLPELQRLLQSTDDWDVQLSSMIALARACDGASRTHAGEFAALCSQRIADGNRSVAEVAVMALGVLGHEPSVVELAALVRDTQEARKRFSGKAVPERTRAFAALSLGLIGARTGNRDARWYAADALLRELESTAGSRADLEAACVLALGAIPEHVEPETGTARKRAEGNGAKGELVPRLLRMLADGRTSVVVRAHLPRTLARLAADTARREEVIAALLVRADDKSERNEVVHGVLLALGSLGTTASEPIDRKLRATLLRHAEASDLQARAFARIALAQSAGRGPNGAIVEDTRRMLVRALEDGGARDRAWSALALGLFEHARRTDGGLAAESATALEGALVTARSPDEVGAFAIAAGLAGARNVVPRLVERLPRVHEPRIQGYVGLALGLLDAREAVEPLRALFVEARKCSEKLPQCAQALALLEDPKLVPDLLALLDQGTSQATLGAALAALGAVGDRRAIAPIRELLADRKSTNTTHAASIAALGRIADRDALPWQHVLATGLNYRAMTTTLSDESHGGLLDLQ